MRYKPDQRSSHFVLGNKSCGLVFRFLFNNFNSCFGGFFNFGSMALQLSGLLLIAVSNLMLTTAEETKIVLHPSFPFGGKDFPICTEMVECGTLTTGLAGIRRVLGLTIIRFTSRERFRLRRERRRRARWLRVVLLVSKTSFEVRGTLLQVPSNKRLTSLTLTRLNFG